MDEPLAVEEFEEGLKGLKTLAEGKELTGRFQATFLKMPHDEQVRWRDKWKRVKATLPAE